MRVALREVTVVSTRIGESVSLGGRLALACLMALSLSLSPLMALSLSHTHLALVRTVLVLSHTHTSSLRTWSPPPKTPPSRPHLPLVGKDLFDQVFRLGLVDLRRVSCGYGPMGK